MQYSKKSYIGLGNVPIGIGAVIKGWDFTEKDFRDPAKLSAVDFRAMTGECPHNCFHCFTDKSAKTLSLVKIKSVIDELAELGTNSIDFVGEGEPTIDEDFFEIIEYTASKGIQPVVFTESAAKLRDKKFVERLYESGASVCSKGDSLWNPDYQNWVVGDKTETYFKQRNEAIALLIKTGFNKPAADGTTRLGVAMVLSKKNFNEVEKTLRYCRENNLWIYFSFFLPAGRSATENFDKSIVLNIEEKRKVAEIVKRVDKEYGFEHDILNNFLTSRCIESMQIYGNGDVSPCSGNETIIGNVKNESIKEIRARLLEKYPKHNPSTFDGYCMYREKF